MPDPYLVGNGRWCTCCFPAGRPDPVTWTRHNRHERRGCNECSGDGRIEFTAEEIVANTVAEVKAWKARERRYG